MAIDNEQAAYDVVSRLVVIGRRRITAIGVQPQEKSSTPQQRTAGFRRSLAEAGLPLEPRYLQPAPHYRRAAGHVAARELLALPEPPDATFCYADPLAPDRILCPSSRLRARRDL